MNPIAVLIHVSDVQLGFEWYKTAFPAAVEDKLEGCPLSVLRFNGFSIEIVLADEKVSSGKRGTVLYWSVDHLTDSLERFYSLGAKLYRGPMDIEDGLSMCQVEDPFGNLIGLRGKLS